VRVAPVWDDAGVSTRTSIGISAALIAVATLVGLALYPQLPDPMPSHWDAAGNVDGYMSRTWGVLLLPLMTAGLAVLLFAIPSMDPLRANIERFRAQYNAFVVGFVAFMVYTYALTLAAGMGRQFNMTRMLLPAMGLLFIGVGRLLRTARRNYFIGIRTPWTLASDEVWQATHVLGARTFTVGGIVLFAAGFLGEAGFWLGMAVLIGAALVPVVYSYVLWRRLGRPGPTP
jgi:uncharacterized membrane protein